MMHWAFGEWSLASDDKRYSCGKEYCGRATARYVLRFCGTLHAVCETPEEVNAALAEHKAQRAKILSGQADAYTLAIMAENRAAKAWKDGTGTAQALNEARVARQDQHFADTRSRSPEDTRPVPRDPCRICGKDRNHPSQRGRHDCTGRSRDAGNPPKGVDR